ncbi:MAG: PAS domain-containing protein [Deltaproteobacteria bacterium]|nr:PAS domain-containing protein [Deltaproteobacteria bacterium]
MKTRTRQPGKRAAPRVRPGRARGAGASFPVVGIGASAGGLEAFIDLVRGIPVDSGMAFVLIQHLDPNHPSYLTEALSRSTTLPVSEVRDGMEVEPNHVYVIPPDADVGILKGVLVLLARTTDPHQLHLPIDFFFKALASDRGSHAIGVVLSGTGSDGTEGLREIKAAGGLTFAQAPESAKFSGMPESAIRAGVVDVALRVPELTAELMGIARHPLLRARDAELLTGPSDASDLKKIFLLLRDAVGVDFSEYKVPTLRRRLARRMALLHLVRLEDYVKLLRESRSEAQAVFGDMLINVTSFFRDKKAFEVLKERILPEIVERKRGDGAIRIWCAGCSTGEEAYSLVITLLEVLKEQRLTELSIQLFGTDISEKAVEVARNGIYPDSAVKDVSPERLSQYFTKLEGGGYRINKFVRERCAFVRHDLASDPPFSKLDLVSCRNVLIYFGRSLQERVIATFHFALTQPGYLLLGRAENIPEGANLFSAVDRDAKIFARSAVKTTLHFAPARDAFPTAPRQDLALASRVPQPSELVRRVEAQLLDTYAPPGVFVNERMDILHFRGHTGPFLEPAPGQPQHNLLKMARKGLLADLRIAFAQVRDSGQPARRAGVRIEGEGAARLCDLVVVPVPRSPESSERVFAVLFEEAKKELLEVPRGKKKEGRVQTRRVEKLEEELQATKAYLQSIIGEHQRTNEDLVTANEELISSNEELQSLNEELETAKEELQSTNEELSTLNEELQTRNNELDSVNSDLMNILASVEVPIVIVDGARRIRRFTPKARPILNLLPGDVGRPIDDIKPALRIQGLDQMIAEVIETVATREEEVRDQQGHWYRLQIRPYTTVDKRVDGAVISIIDIDALKRALGAAEWARDLARATVEAVQTPLVVLDEQLKILSANGAFHERYGAPHLAFTGSKLYDLSGGVWDFPELRAALDGVLARDDRFQRLQVLRKLPKLGERNLSLSARAISTPAHERLILLAVEDVTDARQRESERARLLEDARAAQSAAEKANLAKDVFLATVSHELRTPLSSLLLNAQYLRRGKLDPDRLRRAAEAVERATRVQSQLIDDLLDISRIVAGKLRMEMQAVSLEGAVRAAVDTVAPMASAKRIELEMQLDPSLPPVSGDPVRLQQVVWNLVNNAIKFTPDGGRVTVSLEGVDGRAQLRVTDTGVGIEPAFVSHLFTRFTQEDRGETRAHGGLGLGLAIVRHVVEAHGGTISASSAGRGKGATFTVLLPLMPASTRPVQLDGVRGGASVPLASIVGARVLVVEDDAGTREALTDMLALGGVQVCAVDSAAAAMKVFEEFSPELLVCDIAMPDEDGYSLLGRIRALDGRGRDIPALALTALASEDDHRRALEAGFQLHLAKPIDFDRLVAALASLRQRVPLAEATTHPQ